MPDQPIIVDIPAKSRRWARYFLAVFFILAGANHFLNPRPYLTMMPPGLPFPELLNYLAGVAEVAGGVGILLSRWQRAAGWGLIILLVVIFPANIHIALNGWEGVEIARWLLWARLPLQFVLIAWVYYACLGKPKAVVSNETN